MAAMIRWLAHRRGLALTLTVLLVIAGLIGLAKIPVDAVPDVSNNQVQVVTSAPALAASEVEKAVTLPVERSMAGIPGLKEIRSVSKLGISLVTLIFHDDVDIYFARQQVNERLIEVREAIPATAGRPELGPIATGLGEIYMFEVRSPKHTHEELRTLVDWTIGPRLRQVPGVIEVIGFGGSVKQYRVTVDPARLAAHRVDLADIRAALERDNLNAGGGSIEHAGEQVVLRAEARFRTVDEVKASVVKTLEGGTPLTVGMLADVDSGPSVRQGAMTKDGQGEIVGGSVLLLKGQNSKAVVERVRAEVEALNAKLPAGVEIVAYLDRSDFIARTVKTVVTNLVEGAAIVVLVLFLTLGSVRAGLLTAGAIPFAMLIAFAGLVLTGVSANLMSLGAVDFGIVVEGTVVVTEHALHTAAHARNVRARRKSIVEACAETARPVLFAVVIVLLVFLPLATLEDVEGKMFRPVVISLVFMLAGALFYALVVVPAIAPALLARHVSNREPWLIRKLRGAYEPLLVRAMQRPRLTIAVAFAATALGIAPAVTLGAEFMPRIFEGALAIDARRPVSTSVSQAIALSSETEAALLEIPEVQQVVTRIGRTEGSIDPAGPESGDVFIVLHPRDRWRPGLTPEALVEEMDEKLASRVLATVNSFSQPIEMRVNDLIAGVKSDVALKVFGDDLAEMEATAEKLRKILADTPGAADVKMEVPTGLPALRVVIDRERAARLGVPPKALLDAVEAARVGQKVGVLYEGERTFDLVLRLGGDDVRNANDLARLPIGAADGQVLPLSSVASVVEERGLFQISRERLRRRLVVEANVRGRDLVGFVEEARARIAQVKLPPGVELTWGGQFENYTRAKTRLSLLVPVALGIIAVMLYAAYRSISLTCVTLLTLPFALAGGVLALVFRGMPFSIPAMVGFIALAGVSVMGGAVMTARLLESDPKEPDRERVLDAAISRFRPMISTALVAALGFIPMAISTSAGAEVQRPLATVVIGGLIFDTALAVFAMPAMMLVVMRRFSLPKPGGAADDEDDEEDDDEASARPEAVDAHAAE